MPAIADKPSRREGPRPSISREALASTRASACVASGERAPARLLHASWPRPGEARSGRGKVDGKRVGKSGE